MKEISTLPVFNKLLDNLSMLPGVGSKTSMKYIYTLLRWDKKKIMDLGHNIISLAEEISYCKKCYNISNTDICNICSDESRCKKTLCVVEDIRHVNLIENTSKFRGVYHVLGGVISPIDGIGPNDIELLSLEERVLKQQIEEVILSLDATIEGDTTSFYIHKKLKHRTKVTAISRGISMGEEIDYVDVVTLAKSIENRTLFNV